MEYYIKEEKLNELEKIGFEKRGDYYVLTLKDEDDYYHIDVMIEKDNRLYYDIIIDAEGYVRCNSEEDDDEWGRSCRGWTCDELIIDCDTNEQAHTFIDLIINLTLLGYIDAREE